MDEDPRCFTVKELAGKWRVSQQHVRNLIQRGELGYLRLGRGVRIPVDEVKKYETRNLRRGVQAPLDEPAPVYEPWSLADLWPRLSVAGRLTLCSRHGIHAALALSDDAPEGAEHLREDAEDILQEEVSQRASAAPE